MAIGMRRIARNRARMMAMGIKVAMNSLSDLAAHHHRQ